MYYKRITTKKLGELLLERKIIDKQQLEQALQLQKEEGGYLSQSLLKLSFVTEAEIAGCLSSQYGFPYLPLENYAIDANIIKLVPAELARQCDLIPIDRVGNLLTVVMVDPLNLNAIEELKVITGCHVQTFIGTKTDVSDAVLKYYGPPKGLERKEKAEAIPPFAPEKLINIKGKKGIEKRRFIRLDTNLAFHYAFQEEYKEAKISNISAIGILFTSENVIPLWTFLILQISIPNEDLPVKAVGQVVRVDQLPDNKYQIAVHLTHADPREREKINQYISKEASQHHPQ